MKIHGFEKAIPVENAWTPPSAWYLEADFARIERETVFRNNWIAVGRAAQVTRPGDFFSGTVTDEPFVVLRDQEGVLRAFFNVCRHHATCVAEGAGNTASLVCPYHGWTYDLDGRLRGVKKAGPIRDFDPRKFSLVPMQVTEWCGVIFICPGEAPETPGRQLLELESRLDTMGYGHLSHVATEHYTLECNWKVFADNYLDGGYHVQTIHPWLDAELAMDTYRSEAFDRFSIQSSGGQSAAGVDRMGDGALYAFVYPNLFINRYGSIMDLNLLFPLGPEKCLVVFDYFFEDTKGSEAEAFIAESRRRSASIQQEDIDVCERVQRGLRSSSYDRGRYAPQWEGVMHHFHRLLADDIEDHQ